VPRLLTVLFLQACLGAGMLAAPLTAGWWPRKSRTGVDPAGQLVRWRRMRYDPARDPALGAPAPQLTVLDRRGRTARSRAFAGRTVLLFVGSGST